MSNVEYFSSLTKEKKEAAALLSVGTFLEYFDLMLYVHMSIVLNDLFFPKTDPHTGALIAAFTFCSSYVLRPFGAMLFGYIGDVVGRKVTVIISTFLMSCSCVVMMVVPTYVQVGIIASWIVIICRALQGITSMSEVMGAQLYLTETLKPPVRYPAIALMPMFAVLGAIIALAVASVVTTYSNVISWRIAFLFGAMVALVGSAARTGLKETPDFVDAKRRIQGIAKKSKVDPKLLNNSIVWQEKVKFKTLVALFLVQLMWPVCYYFSFIYCSNTLKASFGYSAAQVIRENLLISIINLASIVFFASVSYKVYPLKILKKLLIPVFGIFIILIPFYLIYSNSAFSLFIVRLLVIIFHPADYLVAQISYSHIPVFKRFTIVGMAFALSHSLGYVISSFSMVYLIKYYNYFGLLIMLLPVTIGFTWAVLYFEKLEIKCGNILRKEEVELAGC